MDKARAFGRPDNLLALMIVVLILGTLHRRSLQCGDQPGARPTRADWLLSGSRALL